MKDLINKNLQTVDIDDIPFPVKVFKNFLNEDFFLNLQKDFPSVDKLKNNIRMDADLTYPDKEYLNLLDASPSYKSFHNFIYSDYFINYFLSIFKKDIEKLYTSSELKINPFKERISSAPNEIKHIFDLKDLSSGKDIFFSSALKIYFQVRFIAIPFGML